MPPHRFIQSWSNKSWSNKTKLQEPLAESFFFPLSFKYKQLHYRLPPHAKVCSHCLLEDHSTVFWLQLTLKVCSDYPEPVPGAST